MPGFSTDQSSTVLEETLNELPDGKHMCSSPQIRTAIFFCYPLSFLFYLIYDPFVLSTVVFYFKINCNPLRNCLFFFPFLRVSPPKMRHNYRFGCFELRTTDPVYYVVFLHYSQKHACSGIVFNRFSPQTHVLKHEEADLLHEDFRAFFKNVGGGNKTLFQKTYF